MAAMTFRFLVFNLVLGPKLNDQAVALTRSSVGFRKATLGNVLESTGRRTSTIGISAGSKSPVIVRRIARSGHS
jgi:hypothetical protein